jgi:hypothetical protein
MHRGLAQHTQARNAALENARTYMNVLYLVQKDIVSNIVILKI